MRHLLLAPVAALALAFAGCSSDTSKEIRLSPAIHIEAPSVGSFGSSDIVMPQSGLHFSVLNRAVVPEGNFLGTAVATVGPADMRRNVLLVQVDGKAGDLLYTMTSKASAKRLFLLVNDKPIGVHLIGMPVDRNVFFDVETVGETPAEKDRELYEIQAKLDEAILKIRKEKENK